MEQPEEGVPTSDRRGMMRLLAAGAVGAVTGAAALRAQPAVAADGDPMVLGAANDATASTDLTTTNDVALNVYGSPFGLVSDGTAGNAIFPGSGPAPAASPGGIMGILYVDAEGNWWASTVDVDPTQGQAVWRKMAGPNTAGQLHMLPLPVRVYDSRPGLPPLVGSKIPTVANGPRSVDTTGNGSGVPMNANAVLITLTVASPRAPGFAAAWSTGPWPGTSNINFAAGQDIATTTVVACGQGASILIQSNAVIDFLVDVIGYYQ